MSIGRHKPNILITGTPGVGKSTLCEQLEKVCDLSWRDISKIAKEQYCVEGYDGDYDCPFLNEDKLLDAMETSMAAGGNLADYHGCDFFPERWFDAVFVLRTDNTRLYDRLAKRGYKGKKLEDNVQCEIFQTVLEEAKESYKEEIIYELENNDEEQLRKNINTILLWIRKWTEEKDT